MRREKLSDEILHGKDIIGGLLVPFLTLEFNYVRKDMRRRVYAMEDDAFAKVNIIWCGGGGGGGRERIYTDPHFQRKMYQENNLK